ncbi:hypothetical protein Y032_0147g2565 [Ancylostoma ceylanicum]|uniref:Uncharacterized protein n=1 Tax=Ancylostoma ceylanicum TaxID=53326 RepID=A0A016T1Z8_9BILA|nr:hypothetical protein Y032_0147g2565 [Ancylostoma ceylanicum]
MFISFLAGDSIIIGVDSDGVVGKAADSQYQNHGTVPGVIRIFAYSSLFGDTKGEQQILNVLRELAAPVVLIFERLPLLDDALLKDTPGSYVEAKMSNTFIWLYSLIISTILQMQQFIVVHSLKCRSGTILKSVSVDTTVRLAIPSSDLLADYSPSVST